MRYRSKEQSRKCLAFLLCLRLWKREEFYEQSNFNGTFNKRPGDTLFWTGEDALAIAGNVLAVDRKYQKNGSQTGSYTNKDGAKVYTTGVIVEGHEFAESKKTSGRNRPGRTGWRRLHDDSGRH